jgi:endonuclease/exonuclease/phosphatase family metal-dependent hydrolase
MGDFNTDMSKSLLPQFISRTGLQTWKADDQSIVTFPALKSRIDWILASSEFRIVEQSVLDDVLSDHRILKAVIGRR